ncbi:unnamed protein product [Cuscuta epithymum]|uniref:DUF4378 domain-containing protein n=1 Tax=Cuscuta epithymum TaxID=186058 RepID=A0AAV0GC32_9ASTE|nr:unnamed protein product [Cuscuta epithymum]
MGGEKHGSKRGGRGGGGYVGGFLQLFDWNAKSRKKLFSSKSDSPEHSKMKKRCDGNLPMTRFHLIDEEMNANTTYTESSCYSYASSMADDEELSLKPPGVVARLMGLDPLPPSSNYSQFYSNSPFSEPNWHSRHHKAIATPIEKFQTETLPPKSAKSIPITHHKLLSPIKSGTSFPPKNAAYIMEAAARIIDPPRPNVRTKPKMPSVGSSSAIPLRVKDLKEKVELASRRLSTGTNTINLIKTHSVNNKSASKERVVPSESEECFGGIKSKGKSISLALQAKENVLKREGSSNPSGGSQKELSDLNSRQIIHRNNNQKKSSAVSALRQNNQKQNSCYGGGKTSSKPQGKRTLSGDSTLSHQQKSLTKSAESSRISSRRLSLEMGHEKKEEVSSSNKNVTRKKQRSIDGDFPYEKNQLSSGNQSSNRKSGKIFQSGGLMDREGTNIVSFTFNAPLSRSTPIAETSRIEQKNLADCSADYKVKKSHPSQGSDLSRLLEQKLRELTEKVEPSSCQRTRRTATSLSTDILHDDAMDIDVPPVSQHHFVFSSTDSQEMNMKHNRQVVEGMDHYMKNKYDRRFPSPVCVFESSYITESCNYSDTDSNTTPSSKQSSSIQAQEIVGIASLKRFHYREADLDLLDSASSKTSGFSDDRKKPLWKSPPPEWELEYVKEILSNTNLDQMMMMMFKDFSIKPHVFEVLESRKVVCGYGNELRLERKILFDCVIQCVESMYRKYGGCGYEMWVKGMSVIQRKDRLAEEVYREILGWSEMRSSMVDELVYKDMSTGFGKWLNFETEAFESGSQLENALLNSLLDEIVSDLLGN